MPEPDRPRCSPPFSLTPHAGVAIPAASLSGFAAQLTSEPALVTPGSRSWRRWSPPRNVRTRICAAGKDRRPTAPTQPGQRQQCPAAIAGWTGCLCAPARVGAAHREVGAAIPSARGVRCRRRASMSSLTTCRSTSRTVRWPCPASLPPLPSHSLEADLYNVVAEGDQDVGSSAVVAGEEV